MMRAYPVAQVRAAERAVMDALPSGTLMQRAAAGLASACIRMLDGCYGARVVILAGGGDNGGDALWAGARLARRGAIVEVIPVTPDRIHEEGLAAVRDAGGRLADDQHRAVSRADLILDGIVGIGGRGGLTGGAAELARKLGEGAASVPGRVVAVDLPSGIDPDTGEAPGDHIVADVTVTFGAYKIGTLVDPGAEAVGRLDFVDIGLDMARAQPEVTVEPSEGVPMVRSAEVLDAADVAALLPRPSNESDKYRRGVVGVRTGSDQYPGAAVLSVGGAVHGGAGMVRYVGPSRAADFVLSQWPEVVIAADPSTAGRVNAWTVGSGLGSDDQARSDIEAILASGVPVVLDADGVQYAADHPGGEVVMTPHAGELARLLETRRDDVERRRVHHALEAARRWNVTTLLKGSTTVVATPDGRLRVNRTGSPALATAGTGDVLAGLVGSLLAAGLDTVDAASVAAFVHGRAGDIAAAQTGYPSAGDVLTALPPAIAAARR